MALEDLFFYVGVQLFAVFLLLELLPVPVDFNIFLVGGDNFVLDLVGTLSFLLFLEEATLVLRLISVRLYLSDRQIRLATDLLQVT